MRGERGKVRGSAGGPAVLGGGFIHLPLDTAPGGTPLRLLAPRRTMSAQSRLAGLPPHPLPACPPPHRRALSSLLCDGARLVATCTHRPFLLTFLLLLQSRERSCAPSSPSDGERRGGAPGRHMGTLVNATHTLPAINQACSQVVEPQVLKAQRQYYFCNSSPLTKCTYSSFVGGYVGCCMRAAAPARTIRPRPRRTR
jgi:hypothetical protein